MGGMGREKPKMTVISVDVTEELRDLVKAAAAIDEVPMSVWVRQLLKRSASAKVAKAKEESGE